MTSTNGKGQDDEERDYGDEEIVPLELYNVDEGKMRASVSWLIAKVYGKNVPDQLSELFYKDTQGEVHLRPPVLYALTSGDLYCTAAAKLFNDNGYLNQNHGAVIKALHRYSIEVLEEGETSVTETVLTQTAPFRPAAHLAMMDGLMMAYMRQIISVQKVVDSVKKHTTVQQNEIPYDVEDSLLFWINKICSAVRDELEKKLKKGKGGEMPLIPEMEDLYEDMCDGACLATLIAFYRPNDLRFTDICFNEPMSVADCVYNLRLVKQYSSSQPTGGPFHFEIEDIMYLHESLRPNVNALLSDLYHAFEAQVPELKSPTGASNRSFTNTRRELNRMGIPDLRGGGQATTSNAGRLTMPRSGRGLGDQNLQSGATSMMNSTDSLMTQKSVDSLRYKTYKGAQTMEGVRKSPTTTFGDLRSQPPKTTRSGLLSPNSSPYSRSDSMPTGSGSAGASIRLQLEEKRRQYETQRMHLNSQLAKERQEVGKEAFFTLLGKPTTSSPSQGSPSNKARTPTGSAASKLGAPPGSTSPLRVVTKRQSSGGSSGEDSLRQNYAPGNLGDSQILQLNKSVQHLHQELRRLSMEQEKMREASRDPHSLNPQHPVIHEQPPHPQGMSIPSQGSNYSAYATPSGQQFQQSSPYGTTPPRQIPHSTSYAGASSAPTSLLHSSLENMYPTNLAELMGPGATYATPASFHMQQQQPPPVMMQSSPHGGMGVSNGGGTFRLHTDTEPPSRLDPSLELSRNLTNWGMTYKQVNRNPRKTWDTSSYSARQSLDGGQQQHQILMQQHQLAGMEQSEIPGQFNIRPGVYGSPQQNEFYQSSPPVAVVEGQPMVVIPNQTATVPEKIKRISSLNQSANSNFKSEKKSANCNPVLSVPNMVPTRPTVTNTGINKRVLTPWSTRIHGAEIQLVQPHGQIGQNFSPVPSQSGADSQRPPSYPSGGSENSFSGMNSSITGEVIGVEPVMEAERVGTNGSEPETPKGTPSKPPVPTKEGSPAVGFVVGDTESPAAVRNKQLEMQRKREELLAASIKRREEVERKKERAEEEAARKRAAEVKKQEDAERKKLEKELRRQKVYENYLKNKAEQDAHEKQLQGPGSNSSSPSANSTPRSGAKVMRGHSQPPRPKSTVIVRAKSNVRKGDVDSRDGMDPSGSMDQLNNQLSSAPSTITVSSIAEPTLKLFAKPSQKSNRNMIYNAIQYSVLAGGVHEEMKRKVLEELAKSASKHFLLLFRDQKCQYRALYTWDEVSDSAHKIHGMGPKVTTEKMMEMMFKYDSGGKKFSHIPSKHLSATIDGFTIKDELWQKKPQPFSGSRR